MIIINLYKKVKQLSNSIKEYFAKKMFISNSITGKNFKCGSSSKCFNNTGSRRNIVIGDNCEILSTLNVECNGKILIGNYTTIREHTKLLAINEIKIGDYVIISNNVTVYDNNNHPTDPEKRIQMSKSGFYGDLWHNRHSDSAPILIEDNVWIGERASILKGVKIGKGSIVAMGAVVTKDVPEYTIAAGNPAKIVKNLSQDYN